MLSQRQIDVVKSTIPLLQSAGTAITEHFYQRMFRHNPELQDIFNMSNQHSGRQAMALFSSIAAYATHIEEPSQLVALVERIANKHASLNIQPSQYAIVGSHLIETLRELAAESFTPEVEDAWTAAYGVLANIFIEREAQIYQSNEAAEGGWRGRRRFRLAEKTPESELVCSFRFVPVDGGPVARYQPGQYLGIEVQPNENGYKEIRQYSLSDAWRADSYRISVKREGTDQPGVVSHYLHDQLQVGDEVELFAPVGDFWLQPADTPVVLVSAGVGVTPMMAILETLWAEQSRREVVWLHACERQQQHSFRERLVQLNAQRPFTQISWYREGDEVAEQLRRGTMALAGEAEQLPLADGDFYLCGPVGFMAAIKRQLLVLGVSLQRIHYEVFGPHADL